MSLYNVYNVILYINIIIINNNDNKHNIMIITLQTIIITHRLVKQTLQA